MKVLCKPFLGEAVLLSFFVSRDSLPSFLLDRNGGHAFLIFFWVASSFGLETFSKLHIHH